MSQTQLVNFVRARVRRKLIAGHIQRDRLSEMLAVPDRALRTEFNAQAELGRLANVFGKLRDERGGVPAHQTPELREEAGKLTNKPVAT
jgi:hypothetical protein